MIYFEPNFVGNDYNLEHPRILWNSVTRRGTIAASSEVAGHPATNAATETTYDTWKPDAATSTWTLTFDSTETVSAVAIDTHTIGAEGCSISPQEWNGAVWVDIVPPVSPADNEPIAFLFAARDLSSLRVSISGGIPQIGVIYVCEAMEIPQRVYGGVQTPVDMALQTEFSTNQSAKGQYLGRSIQRQKKINDFSVEHLKEGWVRTTFMPFMEDAREYPFFLLERPYSVPAALSYRWPSGDIEPQRMGIRDYMSVQL